MLQSPEEDLGLDNRFAARSASLGQASHNDLPHGELSCTIAVETLLRWHDAGHDRPSALDGPQTLHLGAWPLSFPKLIVGAEGRYIPSKEQCPLMLTLEYSTVLSEPEHI